MIVLDMWKIWILEPQSVRKLKEFEASRLLPLRDEVYSLPPTENDFQLSVQNPGVKFAAVYGKL